MGGEVVAVGVYAPAVFLIRHGAEHIGKKGGRLCGRPVLGLLIVFGLAGLQEIGGSLRVARCRENRPLVVLQSFQPSGDIGRVVVPDLRGQVQGRRTGTPRQVRQPVPPSRNPDRQTACPKSRSSRDRVLRPVGHFMGEGRVVGFRVPEAFKGRHLHVIERRDIVGAVPAVPDSAPVPQRKPRPPLCAAARSGAAHGSRCSARAGRRSARR